LADGPGKLCSALHITRAQNGADLCHPGGEVFIAANPRWRQYRRLNGPVATSLRIGITKAADLPLRFYLEKNAFVSRRSKLA
jgi:DNA-3-methyladenine glycosylase